MDEEFEGSEEQMDPELLKEAQAYARGPVRESQVPEMNGEPHRHDGEEQPHSHPDEREPIKAVTAFLVVIMADGTKPAFSDVNTPLELEREAHLNDMYEGACQVQKDVQIMQMSQHVVPNVINGLMMAMQAQMQAMMDQKLAAQAGVNPTGAVLLNRQQRRHGG